MLTVSLVVAVPAGILRAGCVGDTCKDRSVEGVRAPFCSLPDPVREQIAAGYRKGRSPELLGVTAEPGLAGPVGPGWRENKGALTVVWPAIAQPADVAPAEMRQAGVALALGGAGIGPGEIPAGATLADVAPTVAEAIGLDRPHPEVRSGSAWPGFATGESPSLVLEIVWKGTGRAGDAAATRPFKEVAALGAGAEALTAGSLPLDPAALMATLGSGAVPSEHGITGAYTRSEDGSLTEAWSESAPGSVVAMLADDLDETPLGLTALIGDAPTDVGLVGSDWYLSGDKDEVSLHPGSTPADQAQRATELLRFMRQGFRQDGMVNLVAVTMQGETTEMARSTLSAMEAAERFAPGDVLYVLASLPNGSSTEGSGSASASDVAAEIESAVGAPVIEATAGGGFFLDQEVIANEGVAEDAILSAMDKVRAPSGEPLFADRFSGVAVTFARYC